MYRTLRWIKFNNEEYKVCVCGAFNYFENKKCWDCGGEEFTDDVEDCVDELIREANREGYEGEDDEYQVS